MIQNIILDVITPVHVGMGQEKRMMAGLDFAFDQRNGAYYVYKQQDWFKRLHEKERNAVTGFMVRGEFSALANFIRHNNLISEEQMSYKWDSILGPAEEVRRTFQDGMGRYYIPGSAIKGSIRSVLGTSLKKQGEPFYGSIFGSIDNNLMRFLQVTDCYLEQSPGIYPVKVYSADNIDGRREGMWKNKSNGGHTRGLDTSAFVTFFEMFTDGVNTVQANGRFRVNWGGSDFVRSRVQAVPNIELFNRDEGVNILWRLIRESTKRHIEKEILFFETYQNDSLKESFFDELKWLSDVNLESENSCLLRIGGNVGWHSITGDWKYNDYIDAVERNRSNIVKGRQLAYKTRKLGFDYDEHGNLRFFLPGFVKLTKVSAST
jgi:CRISPR/Cas system CSM-associated protein Csm5 (group 7 of RAMP superfamily)